VRRHPRRPASNPLLGLEARSDPSIPGLITFLEDKRMLLVPDNCEHVIEAVAASAVSILRGAPGAQILATSREPLRAESEHGHRLSPPESPSPSAGAHGGRGASLPGGAAVRPAHGGDPGGVRLAVMRMAMLVVRNV
jgi:hypothetical protein